MFKLIGGLIDRVCVVAGAVVFAQAPHFFQAYTQRLGGHLGEVHNQLVQIRTAAERSGKSLEEYIAKFTSHVDPDISRQGEFMQSLATRFTELTKAYMALIHSTPWERPFAFLRHLQADIAETAFQDFHFGLELTTETAIYALIGMGAGYLLFSTIHAALHLPKKLFYDRLSSRISWEA
jgi:hypothetical protein